MLQRELDDSSKKQERYYDFRKQQKKTKIPNEN